MNCPIESPFGFLWEGVLGRQHQNINLPKAAVPKSWPPRFHCPELVWESRIHLDKQCEYTNKKRSRWSGNNPFSNFLTLVCGSTYICFKFWGRFRVWLWTSPKQNCRGLSTLLSEEMALYGLPRFEQLNYKMKRDIFQNQLVTKKIIL